MLPLHLLLDFDFLVVYTLQYLQYKLPLFLDQPFEKPYSLTFQLFLQKVLRSLSSSAPGPSPINIIFASLFPTPKTIFCLVLHNLHLLQFTIDCSNSSHVSNIFYSYFTHCSINSIFCLWFVSIFAFVPIGITVFVSICPK